MPNEIVERRDWPIEDLRVVENDGKRHLTWYASVFDSISEDLGGFREQIGRRAFTKTLMESDVRALFNHDPSNLLGRTGNSTLSLTVDVRGLRATVELPDTQLGRDLQVLIERRDINAGSFGFRATQVEWSKLEDGTPLRIVKEARLYDVSPVTFPAYQGTTGGMALRAALADLVNLDDLTHPLLKHRAGLPLGDEEKGRVEEVLTQLRGALLEPPASEEEPVILPELLPARGHSAAAAIRRRHLELLNLKEGI